MTTWVTIKRGGVEQTVPEQDLTKYTKGGWKRVSEQKIDNSKKDEKLSAKQIELQKQAEAEAELKEQLEAEALAKKQAEENANG